jgi:hypothetical protein
VTEVFAGTDLWKRANWFDVATIARGPETADSGPTVYLHPAANKYPMYPIGVPTGQRVVLAGAPGAPLASRGGFQPDAARAEMWSEKGGVWILATADGISINGRPIEPGDRAIEPLKKVRLHDGDWLQIGTTYRGVVRFSAHLLPPAPRSMRYDPTQPVGIRNMPPWNELEFSLIPGSARRVILVSHNGEPIAVYKPSLPDMELRNELVARPLAKLLFDQDVVPDSREWIGPEGRGLLLQYVPNDPIEWHRPPHYDFRSLRGQMIAVLDYVGIVTDRHAKNALGRADQPDWVVGIDHETMFSQAPGDRGFIKSGFVAANFGTDALLDERIRKRLAAVQPGRLRDLLLAHGYTDVEASWAELRLQEIREAGTITGRAWNRPIEGVYWADPSASMSSWQPSDDVVEARCVASVIAEFDVQIRPHQPDDEKARTVSVTPLDVKGVEAVGIEATRDAIVGPRDTRPSFRVYDSGPQVLAGFHAFVEAMKARGAGVGLLAIVGSAPRTGGIGHAVLWRTVSTRKGLVVQQWDPDKPKAGWAPLTSEALNADAMWQAAFFRADGTPVITPKGTSSSATVDPDSQPLPMLLAARTEPAVRDRRETRNRPTRARH